MRVYATILVAGVALSSAVAISQSAPTATTPAAEIAKGKRLYIRCAACHAVSPTPQAKVGPHLKGIVGRKSAAVAGFNYSPAMRRANIVWNDATLDRWLLRPQAVVPGTTMAFAGMPNAADRRALIAYLRRPN